MKKLLYAIGAVIVLLIVAVLVIPAVVPVETYRSQILAQVKAATGREARIDGDLRLSILPRVEIVAGKVSLANAPGRQPANMVSLDKMTVRVALLPLISGDVQIDTFVLERPVIHLEIDKSGTPNWEFKTAETAAGKPQPAETKPQPAAGGTGFAPGSLKLGDVRLVDGRVSYFDARTDVRQQAEGINLTVSLPSLDSPMRADGSLVWNREKIVLALELSHPNAFLAGRKTEVEARVSAAPVKLSFKGTAANAKTLQLGGVTDLDVPSIRKLAAWAGAELKAPGSGYGPLKIAGTVDVNGNWIAFRNARLSVDKINGTGDFVFDGRHPTPMVTANLKLDKLDINPYLPPEQKAAPETKPTSAGGTGAAQGPTGWSDDPIDMSGLKAVDADLDLSVGGILVRKIKIGDSSLKVTLRKGVLVADLAKMALYNGSGRAKVTTNAAGSVPKVALTFDLANFQANPFLSDAIGFDRIEGAANADLDVTTSGRSVRQFVSALNGAGKVKFLNGAVRGINLAAMVRNIKGAFLDASARAAQKTDFAELGGTYRITNGILTNTDLQLKSPLLRLAGKGTVDLPKRHVNYRIEPKVVATIKGQGGSEQASGLTVPVVVEGPWDNLSYRPDLAGAIGEVAKDPTKALESIKGVLPGKLGSGGTAPAPDKPSPVSEPVETLKKLFGR